MKNRVVGRIGVAVGIEVPKLELRDLVVGIVHTVALLDVGFLALGLLFLKLAHLFVFGLLGVCDLGFDAGRWARIAFPSRDVGLGLSHMGAKGIGRAAATSGAGLRDASSG